VAAAAVGCHPAARRRPRLVRGALLEVARPACVRCFVCWLAEFAEAQAEVGATAALADGLRDGAAREEGQGRAEAAGALAHLKAAVTAASVHWPPELSPGERTRRRRCWRGRGRPQGIGGRGIAGAAVIRNRSRRRGRGRRAPRADAALSLLNLSEIILRPNDLEMSQTAGRFCLGGVPGSNERIHAACIACRLVACDALKRRISSEVGAGTRSFMFALLTMPSEQIDANVRPSKTEVRFLTEAENIDAIASKAAAAIEERVDTRRMAAQSGPKDTPGAGPTKRWGRS
jgi:hypothetical protein